MIIKNHHLVLISILFLASALRFAFLGQFPIGFAADEANFGYTAYSIAQTGKDEWGQFLPFAPRTFGDYKAPLYIYLTVPSVAVFGLNEFSTRFPAAFIGVLAVWATYLLTRQLFGLSSIALLAAFLLAISPWYWSLSRVGIETSLVVFFLPFIGYLLIKSTQNAGFLVWALMMAGIGVYASNSARFFIPLFVGLWLFRHREFYLKHKQMSVVSLICFALLLAPLFGSLTTSFTKRPADVAIFNPTDNWQSVAERQFESDLPRFWERLFTNKLTYVLESFTKNYVGYLSPQFLLTQGPSEATYGMIPGRGVLHLFELPLIVASLIFLFIRKNPFRLLLIFWLVTAPIPAALTKTVDHASRAAIMLPLLHILSSYGAFHLWQICRYRFKSSFMIGVGFWVVVALSTISFGHNYLFHAPKQFARQMDAGAGQLVAFLGQIGDSYQTIVIDRPFSEPQIFVAFYLPIAPLEYQRYAPALLAYQEQGKTFIDQLENYRIGKFVFRSINWPSDSTLPNVLLVAKADKFPQGVEGLKTFTDSQGRLLYKVVDPQRL